MEDHIKMTCGGKWDQEVISNKLLKVKILFTFEDE